MTKSGDHENEWNISMSCLLQSKDKICSKIETKTLWNEATKMKWENIFQKVILKIRFDKFLLVIINK